MNAESQTAKVAAIQMTSGADVQENLLQAGRLIEQAAARGADFVLLPENFSFMGRDETERLAVAEDDGDGPAQEFLRDAARRHGLWLVGGTVPVKRADEARVAAASFVFDPQGRCVSRYDKIHLFDVVLPGSGHSYRESDGIAPGHVPTTVETALGLVGLSVCYDLRFPELYRLLVERGALLLTVPAAFTAATGEAHWEVLLRARAVENLCYVVASGQQGRHSNGRETWGDSLIVDPWGRVLDRCAPGPGVALADVNLPEQAELRRRFPVLTHRRFPSPPL